MLSILELKFSDIESREIKEKYRWYEKKLKNRHEKLADLFFRHFKNRNKQQQKKNSSSKRLELARSHIKSDQVWWDIEK